MGYLLNSKRDIYVTRGNTMYLLINLKKGDKIYNLKDNDSIVFSVKEYTDDITPKYRNVYTKVDCFNGKVRVGLSAYETSALPKEKYVYDITLRINETDSTEVVNRNIFLLDTPTRYDEGRLYD